MLRWEVALILIVVGVNVLSHIVRALKKEAEAEKSDPRADARERRPARPKPPTDVDLFLERINQRRKEAAARQAMPPRPEPVPVRPAPAPKLGRAAAAPARPRPEPRPATRRPTTAEVVVVELPAQPTAPPPVTRPTVTRRPAPAAARVAALLRTPAGRQAAFILQEVLGKPVGMRFPRALPGRRVPGLIVPDAGDQAQ